MSRAQPEDAPRDCVVARRMLDQAGRRLTQGFGHHRAFIAEAGLLLGPAH